MPSFVGYNQKVISQCVYVRDATGGLIARSKVPIAVNMVLIAIENGYLCLQKDDIYGIYYCVIIYVVRWEEINNTLNLYEWKNYTLVSGITPNYIEARFILLTFVK